MKEKSTFSNKRNLELIEKFKREMLASGLSEGSWQTYHYSLRKLAESLEVEFDQAMKEDIIKAVQKIRNNLAESTVATILAKIKRFYKWLNGGEEYPECVSWINTSMKNTYKLPDELLSREEIRQMIDACNHPHERALISTLYESGLRAGEFLELNIGSVDFEEKMGRIILPREGKKQKTGQRRVPLINSVPHLQEWINHHPSGSRNDPLWISFANQNMYGRLTHRGLASKLKKISRIAGIEKKVYPHLFRHSRATEIAGKGIFSEAEMRIIFGWSKGSDMPSKYIHLSGGDVDDKFKKIHGIATVDKGEEQNPLKPVNCPRCGYRNPPGTKFCGKCGLALDEETALELDREEDFADEVASEMGELNDEGSLEELIEKAVERRVKEEMREIRKKLVREGGTG